MKISKHNTISMNQQFQRRIASIALLLIILVNGLAYGQQSVHADFSADIPYSVATTKWPEKNGAHRAVLKVNAKADAVRINFLWRRHDKNPGAHLLLITNAQGIAVTNIYRNLVNNERCDIVAGPVNPGTYYFYYLPYTPSSTFGYFSGAYSPQEAAPSSAWVSSNKLTIAGQMDLLPVADVTEIQARTSYDVFYPMELIPTNKEKTAFMSAHTDEYLLFPEDRVNKIIMRDEIPYKWTLADPDTVFSGVAAKNEYYCYQLGVLASTKNLTAVAVKLNDLVSASGEIIPVKRQTCFNTEGIDPNGKSFTTVVNVTKGKVQPFWIGIDIAPNQAPGIYSGWVSIKPSNSVEKKIRIKLEVINSSLADRGDKDLWRYSRLRWFNSKLGLDSTNVAPYTPVQKIGATSYKILGRDIQTSSAGLPVSIKASSVEILSNPINFVIETVSGQEVFSNVTLQNSVVKSGMVVNEYVLENTNFLINLTVNIESDGLCYYKYAIKAKGNISVKDIRLEIPFRPEIGQYIMGMGQRGTYAPTVGNSITKKWNTGPYQTFWVGNTYGGIFCRMLGASYTGPLLAVYNPAPPASWNNGGNGGVTFSTTSATLMAKAFSGARTLSANQNINFEFSLLITPVKPLNTKSQFTDLYNHTLPCADPSPTKNAISAGVKIVNVHHATNYNPFINYPFIENDSLSAFTKKYHAKGMKVKIYYTIRELSNMVAEMWALRSFGNEILANGSGGGFPWLQEHLIDGYSVQWYAHCDPAVFPDAAIQNSVGLTRWYNYYIEGLAWLLKNIDIDGIYLDDVSYDRSILKRIRKVMETTKPGCLIDLHSNTSFSKGAAIQYTEFFPYVDKLWFGEGFDYNTMSPDNWLIEASGIPFGLMSDQMIYGYGNQYRGMVYGNSTRDGNANPNPEPLWNFWNKFGMADAKMIGY